MEIIGGPEGLIPNPPTFGSLVLRNSTEIFIVCDAMLGYPQYDYDTEAFEQVMMAIDASTRPLLYNEGSRAVLPVIVPSGARPLMTAALKAFKGQVPNEATARCIDRILSY